MTARFGAAIEVGLPVARTARRAEAAGFDLVAVGEHVAFRIPTSNPFVALGVAAGATERIRLLSSVTLLPLYPAVLAAKLVAELAHHSGGRFDFGVGVGGEFPAEFEACGVPLSERGARTEEGLVVMRRLLTEDDVDFEGRFSRFRGLTLQPRPPRPPDVWVGGRRRAATARAGRYADVWMPYLVTPQQLAEGLADVRAHATRSGRDPDAVSGAVYAWMCLDDRRDAALDSAAAVLSANYGMDMRGAAERYAIAGPPDACAARVREYLEAGATSVIFAPIAETAPGREAMIDAVAADVLPICRT